MVLPAQIGSGSFGDIYLGVHKDTGEKVAMKLESSKAKHPQLHYEAGVYKTLVGATGIPRVHWFGIEGSYNVLVMDLLGRSLEDLFTRCGRRFTLKTVLMLADQMLERLQMLHGAGLLHRDIKPDNFLIGVGEARHVIFLVDFGLTRSYLDKSSKEHIEYSEGRHLTGTPRYASVNNHLGIQQSRRDDLESLGFVLMYFLRGSLPWQGIKARTKKQKYEKILRKKLVTPSESLCRGFPPQFVQYFEYCRSLRFDDAPDYDRLRKQFKQLAGRSEIVYDWVFDWNKGSDTSNFEGVSRHRKTSSVVVNGELGGGDAGRAGASKKGKEAKRDRKVYKGRRRKHSVEAGTGAGGGAGAGGEADHNGAEGQRRHRSASDAATGDATGGGGGKDGARPHGGRAGRRERRKAADDARAARRGSTSKDRANRRRRSRRATGGEEVLDTG